MKSLNRPFTSTTDMAEILLLSGPNLNMLGLREPGLYGAMTLAEIHAGCAQAAARSGLGIDCRQSNHEGELVTWIQQAHPANGGDPRGLIINAGAYTHTSIAILDALKLLEGIPVIEVHITNPKEREAFRHVSYIEPVAAKTIAGQGAQGYVLAVEYLSSLLQKS